MDVLLTHAYFLSEDPQEREVMRPYPPLGLLYISAYLKAHDFDVAVFDSTFRHRTEFERILQQDRPPVVGIYCNLITRPSALRLIHTARRYGARVVVGGPEPANYPARDLAPGADVVVIGEGEATMPELLPHLIESGLQQLHGIAGIAFKQGDEIIATPPRPFIQNLDALPFPDRAAIDLDLYLEAWRRHHGRGSVSLITARGCPYTCTWCSHSVFGYSHRPRSPQNVADEVEFILDRYRPDMLWYADDVFTIKPSWFRAYADELERRSIRIPFETISREDRIDEEVARRLAEMGCFRLWIGSESGSQSVLDRMKRRTNAARVPEVVQLLQRHGIEAGMFIMLGYEGETEADLRETVECLKRAMPDRLLTTLAYPIKGTPYYEEVADRVVALRSWSDGSDRDLTVAGRRSRRYFVHANRWVVNTWALHRERQRGASN